eukprot:CAMPEP_0170528784 /NCGR_PEP_ID=MMETSP0209-20121228/14241_1 /TAXON_ID=665100 ORGANISM="Litonotus pictus, Strain P1" /NCGR_SAMPLE_ID=MMETSP0209 /ASSEMBLY_ACC=CAM_ASM_000301 /LENGTH=716 /DNA_ID=CAMNT_0010820183 /DNA_START=44 /DNA_END=2194 /DNA_ORIENTATION=+
MSQGNLINAVNPYLSDVGVGLVFGLGYYLINYIYGDKKKEQKKQSLEKLRSAINFEHCKSLEDFNQLIKMNEENLQLNPFDLIERMNSLHISPDINTYNYLLNSCFVQDNFEHADKLTEDLFDFASPVHPDLSTFNILLKGISCKMEYINPEHREEKRKQVVALDKLLEQMKALAETNNSIKPNDVTINTSMDILIKAGETKRAWEMFENMQTEYGVKPDKYSYSTIIKALKYDPDQEKLEKAFGIIEFLKTQTDSHTNDEIIFNCLIDVCVRLNQMDKAEKLLSEMKDLKVEPTKVTYAIMIKGYGQIYKLEKAFQLFEEMKLLNLPPNEVVYGCLLNACVRCSNIDKVTDIYKEMKQLKLNMNIILYTTLIKAYSKVKDLKSSLDVYYSMLNDTTIKPNIVVHNAILDCCVECRDTKKLNEIYQLIKEKAMNNEENSPQPDLITYSTVIKGYSRARDMDKVFDVYKFLKENTQFKMDEIIFNSVLDGCAKTNDFTRGLEVYADMEGMGIKKSNVTYSILVKIYSNAGLIEKALAVLEEMMSKGIKPGIIVFTCLIQTCLKNKKFQRAIDLFETMKENNKADHVLYNTIINGCLYHQQWEHACKYTIESLDMGVKIALDLYNSVLNKITAHYCNMKISLKMEYAQVIVGKMKEKGVVLPEDTYSKVAKLLYQTKGSKVEKEFKSESLYSSNSNYNNSNKRSNNYYKGNGNGNWRK